MIIENPDPEILAKWGPLAYVPEEERKRILDGSYGSFKPAVERIEKEIKAMLKRKKAKEAEKKRFARFDEVRTTKG